MISPDGKRVIAEGISTGGTFSVYPVAGGTPATLPGDGEAGTFRFSGARTGRLCTFIWRNSRQIHRVDTVTGKRTLWREISPADPAGLIWIESVQLPRDSSRIVYGYSRILSDLFVIDGLK